MSLTMQKVQKRWLSKINLILLISRCSLNRVLKIAFDGALVVTLFNRSGCY